MLQVAAIAPGLSVDFAKIFPGADRFAFGNVKRAPAGRLKRFADCGKNVFHDNLHKYCYATNMPPTRDFEKAGPGHTIYVVGA